MIDEAIAYEREVVKNKRKNLVENGYNKALNDFVNVCEKQFTTMYGQRYVDLRDIKNIAVQLKEENKEY